MDLDSCFKKSIKDNDGFTEAISIAKSASTGGNIWTIGGTVFRNIIKELYNTDGPENYDFDFIFEKPVNVDYLEGLKNWKILRTGLGEPCLLSDGKQIDFIWLDNSVNPHEKTDPKSMSTEEKLQSYLRRVPLNIQSIVYDINNKRVIGDVGIKAIEERKVRVNNIEECINFCKRRKISFRKFMTSKGKDLDFQVDFPVFNEKSKQNTIDFYNTYADEYTQERGKVEAGFIEQYLSEEAHYIINNTHGKKLLDIGSGPGRDALYFKSNGLDVTCIDGSEEMVNICKRNGLNAEKMDIENISYSDSLFDVAWAYASLVHIPKRRIFNTLARISEILTPDGLLFVGMVEGENESLYKSESKPDKERFFSLYKDEEFKGILKDYFDIVKSKKLTMPNGEKYLNYLCKKKVDNSYKRVG